MFLPIFKIDDKFRHDLLIVLALLAGLFALTGVYFWLSDHVFTGMASIWVATLWVLIAIFSTAIAGVFLQCLYRGFFGIFVFWVFMFFFDLFTSSAGPYEVLRPVLVCMAVQIAVLAFAGWLAGKDKSG